MPSQTPEILLDERFEHPEGIVWDAAGQRLLWLDIFLGHVLTYDLASGRLTRLDLGEVVGAVAPRRDGGLVCAVGSGFVLLSPNGELQPCSDHLQDEPAQQMNDGAVDARGRFWAGSMSFDYTTRPGPCSLYRLDPDGTVTRQLDGVSVSNGIGWSPDDAWCYYADSPTYGVERFAFDVEEGTLGARSTFCTVDAMPDGLAVDVDGCVWVALYGGSEVRRFTPAGELDRVVRLPGSQVTTCTFGGADLRTLFISVSPYGMDPEVARAEQAGYIYALDAGVAGAPTHAYLG